MKYRLLILAAFACFHTYAQQTCPQNSRLFWFDTASHTRHFTEKLGNHPEFPFLQKVNGVTSVASFIKAIHTADKQEKYTREFKAFDALLKNSGFSNDYIDLDESKIENLYLPRKIIGNLGFYDRKKDQISYINVKLNPTGEEPAGIAAWKLKNVNGCYLYILHTCGNAFYPNKRTNIGKYASDQCCHTLSLEVELKPMEL